MSKIADALNNIQKNQENSRQQSSSVFVQAVDEKLRPRSRYEAVASVMMVLRPLILLASVAVVLVVFSYGVRQGMKIEKAIADTTDSAADSAAVNPAASEPEYYLADAPAEDARPVDAPALSETSGVTVQPVTQIEAPQAEAAVQSALIEPIKEAAEDTPPAPAAEEGKFTLQLITYVGQPRASEEVEKLKKQGYNAFVIPSGKHHQVCINRFQTKELANDFLAKARKDGLMKTYPGAYVRAANS